MAGKIREEEETARLTSVFDCLHQEAFDAGRYLVSQPT